MKTQLLSATLFFCLGIQANDSQLQDSLSRDQGATSLKDVVVTGSRSQTDLRHLPLTVSVVDRDALTSQQRVNVLPTLAEQVPGLFVTSRGIMGYGLSTGSSGNITVRGLSSGTGQLLVLIDGHPQYNGIFGHSIADSYQTLMAERVEVVRGPASLLYGGNAMGGVVNIVTRAMRENGTRGQFHFGAGSYGTIQTELGAQTRQGRYTSTIAMQYSRSDNHRPNMAFEQFGGYIKEGYELSDNWNISADLSLTHFNATNPGSVQVPMIENKQWITRGTTSLLLEHHYDNVSGALSVFDNFGRHKINDGYRADGGTPQTDLFRSKDAVAGVSWYESARLFEGNRVTAGVDYQHIYGRAYFTDRQTDTVVTTPRRLMSSAHTHENEVAAYVDFRQDITSWLTVDAGVRYDHHSTAGGEWVPQAGIVWRPITDGQFKATVSKGFRNPNTREMYLYGTANHDSLHAERMMNYELAWRHQLLRGRLSYGVNLFLIEADNLIQTVENRNINSGDFENKGIELEASYRLNSRWTLTTNHSFLDMEKPVLAAPKYKGYLGASYHCAAWSFMAGLQQVSGLYTKVGDDSEKESFTLLNATASYQLTKQIRLWAKGDNLLGQHYEINAGYPMPKATFMGGVNVSF